MERRPRHSLCRSPRENGSPGHAGTGLARDQACHRPGSRTRRTSLKTIPTLSNHGTELFSLTPYCYARLASRAASNFKSHRAKSQFALDSHSTNLLPKDNPPQNKKPSTHKIPTFTGTVQLHSRIRTGKENCCDTNHDPQSYRSNQNRRSLRLG